MGPLTRLIGVWTGTGIDTVPDSKGGSTRTPFLQQLTFEAIPRLTYGAQTVRALRYSCLDWATDDTSKLATMFPVFEENGYFIWIPEKNSIVLQVSNPRGLSMLASGPPKPDGSFAVTTEGGNGGVLVTSYLQGFANAIGYETSVKFENPETLRYANDTLLKQPDGSIFHQTDITTLKRY
ncbi:heme-binding beta-barrel domain-containing protein [Bradyrhizobium sp. USDA 10063]